MSTNVFARNMNPEEWRDYMVREYNALADRWQETYAIASDMADYIERHYKPPQPNAAQLLARFAELEGRTGKETA